RPQTRKMITHSVESATERPLTIPGHRNTSEPPNIPAPRPVPPRARQAVLAAGGGRSRTARTLAAVLGPVEACGQIAEGAGFSDTLNRAAYTLGGLIAAGRLSQEEAERALPESAAAARPGQERRAEQIIRSGLAAGLKRPLHQEGRP
ncbi:bifunctional DNA primase/polymerase, partial [Streptomyces sp. NPDC002845]